MVVGLPGRSSVPWSNDGTANRRCLPAFAGGSASRSAGGLTKRTNVRTVTPMNKGEQTRAAILDVALLQASEGGFESLTIGGLAERAGLSKSGLYAHFGSREQLQVAAIEAAAARFTETVFLPALKVKRGLPRLRALFDHWLDWTARSGLTHGCPMQAAAIEFDDRPGPVRDAVVEHFGRLERELGRGVQLAVSERHFRADLDVEQFVFDMIAIVLAYYHSARLFDVRQAGARARNAFERLVATSSAVA
jgi:AcrR family transcriptional regulator